jgi:hypothetical protein
MEKLEEKNLHYRGGYGRNDKVKLFQLLRKKRGRSRARLKGEGTKSDLDQVSKALG